MCLFSLLLLFLLLVVDESYGLKERITVNAIQRQIEDEDTFWRKLVLPQEERMRLGIPWCGGYRWFRSPNVVPIEQWRKKRPRPKPPQAIRANR